MIIKKQYVNGYIETIRGTFVKKKQANEFKLVQSIQDGLMTINHLSFVNHFEDYVLSDGSEYVVKDATETPKLDENGLEILDDNNNPVMVQVPAEIENRPSFDDLIQLSINGVMVDVQFTKGVANLSIVEYTEKTIIISYLTRTDNLNILLNDDTEKILHFIKVRDESYKEYLETTTVFGEYSEQAQAAKLAYIEAFNNCSVMCRQELEYALQDALSDANRYFGYYMNEKGWWG